MTDCFAPIEEDYSITYETIEKLNEREQPYLIVTKSDLVADDKYIDVMDVNLSHIQITVTTTDDDLSKTYENAPPPSDRIKAIEKLQDKGFDVQLRLSPFIPEYVDFEKLNQVEVDKLLVEFLRVNSWIEKWLKGVDFSKYTVKQSGYKHLPLEVKQELISHIDFPEMSVCEDEDEAHQYWKDNFNHNPDDCCNLRKGKEDKADG